MSTAKAGLIALGIASIIHVAFIGAVVVGSSVSRTPKAAKPTSPESAATKPDTTKPSDKDKEDFLAVVRQNAQDPTGAEILTWGFHNGTGRMVRFRCKLIDTAPGGKFAPSSPRERGGDAVSVEDAFVEYDGDKIKSVHLPRTHRSWHPK